MIQSCCVFLKIRWATSAQRRCSPTGRYTLRLSVTCRLSIHSFLSRARSLSLSPLGSPHVGSPHACARCIYQQSKLQGHLHHCRPTSTVQVPVRMCLCASAQGCLRPAPRFSTASLTKRQPSPCRGWTLESACSSLGLHQSENKRCRSLAGMPSAQILREVEERDERETEQEGGSE